MRYPEIQPINVPNTIRRLDHSWTSNYFPCSKRSTVATKMASFSVEFRGIKKKLQKIDYLTKSKNYFEDITLESAHIYGSHKNLGVSCTKFLICSN